jgi:hypothetical protein
MVEIHNIPDNRKSFGRIQSVTKKEVTIDDSEGGAWSIDVATIANISVNHNIMPIIRIDDLGGDIA